jgi:hypothetical protein
MSNTHGHDRYGHRLLKSAPHLKIIRAFHIIELALGIRVIEYSYVIIWPMHPSLQFVADWYEAADKMGVAVSKWMIPCPISSSHPITLLTKLSYSTFGWVEGTRADE